MYQKLLYGAIWIFVLGFYLWMREQPGDLLDSLEELFWFSIASTMIVYSAPHLKNTFLICAWVIYCFGLLLDLLDDFIAVDIFPVIAFDTSLKQIGFLLICYALYTMIVRKRETITRLNDEIQQRKKLEQKLKFDATHDELTQIGNRRACFTQFTKLCEQHPTLFYFDLDDFKNANDKYGHNCGDAILKKIATALSDVFGADNCFRIGGDEFVAFGSQTQNDDEKLRHKLLEEVFEYGVGMSIGHTDTDTDTAPDKLLHLADAAMYNNKSFKSVRSRPRQG
ncbi:GGDEF domain-containing protein [Pseudoalteromonas sp. SMS1]|uniref:GGDEF domain-containing protein n=1 Tax=Pseudoalteromonas sp. SMS1 TaxID=2908894 RepID=UPI001F2D1BDC|nr:GGDEF domain-containing protein [Pseudoalteromonas sp. SMS1]MCF2859861.1 GGDEF domain-containing protein [Pseudoalteromonas sp. SMS1]